MVNCGLLAEWNKYCWLYGQHGAVRKQRFLLVSVVITSVSEPCQMTVCFARKCFPAQYKFGWNFLLWFITWKFMYYMLQFISTCPWPVHGQVRNEGHFEWLFIFLLFCGLLKADVSVMDDWAERYFMHDSWSGLFGLWAHWHFSPGISLFPLYY